VLSVAIENLSAGLATVVRISPESFYLRARGDGLNLVHFARSSASEVGANLNLARNSARAGKIYLGASV
jgi:hypothetical protein